MIRLKSLLKEDNFNLTDVENKLGFDSGANRDPKTGNLINTTNNLMIVFSGNEKFMDRVAINVLKKYGFDKTISSKK